MRVPWFRALRFVVGWGLAATSLVPVAAAAARRATDVAVTCVLPKGVTSVPELSEGSGLAASRSKPGRFWSHNDGGAPALFALDATGRVEGRIRVAKARVEDWEGLASGSCAKGSCLFVGDIGDNREKRKTITVYRLAEPAATEGSVEAEAFDGEYPDGAHNAETLLVAPDGRLHVVTKNEGAVRLFRFPADPRPGATAKLEQVGEPHVRERRVGRDLITDGAVSPDGTWVALRTTGMLTFYRAAEFFSGTWREAGRVDLRPLREPQGEAVAFGPDGAVFLAGEGGGKKKPGSFARLSCVFPAGP
jgi:hypothetical protein